MSSEHQADADGRPQLDDDAVAPRRAGTGWCGRASGGPAGRRSRPPPDVPAPAGSASSVSVMPARSATASRPARACPGASSLARASCSPAIEPSTPRAPNLELQARQRRRRAPRLWTSSAASSCDPGRRCASRSCSGWRERRRDLVQPAEPERVVPRLAHRARPACTWARRAPARPRTGRRCPARTGRDSRRPRACSSSMTHRRPLGRRRPGPTTGRRRGA